MAYGNVDASADGDVIGEGETVTQGALLVRHAQGYVHYRQHVTGVVTGVARITTGLPDHVRLRIEVTVQWPGPLELGDELVGDGRPLGYLDAIVDEPP